MYDVLQLGNFKPMTSSSDIVISYVVKYRPVFLQLDLNPWTMSQMHSSPRYSDVLVRGSEHFVHH